MGEIYLKYMKETDITGLKGTRKRAIQVEIREQGNNKITQNRTLDHTHYLSLNSLNLFFHWKVTQHLL